MYVKLGKNAESFSDPISEFSIIRGEVKELSKSENNSQKTKRALTGGHLAYASKEEFQEFDKTNKKAKKLLRDSKPSSKDGDNVYKKQIGTLEEAVEDLTDTLVERDEEIETLKEEKIKLNEEIETLKGDEEVNLEEKTKEELVDYYKSEYDVEEEEVKTFAKKNKDDMITELKELASED